MTAGVPVAVQAATSTPESSTGQSHVPASLIRLRADISHTILVRRLTLLGYLVAVPLLRLAGVPLDDTVIVTLLVWLASTAGFAWLLAHLRNERAVQIGHTAYLLFELWLMLVVVHHVGGIGWVGVFFPVFTIYYACTLLPRWGALLVTGGTIVGVSSLALAEAVGILPHLSLYVQRADDYRDPPYILGTLVLVVIGGYSLTGFTFERFGRLQRQTAAAEHERTLHMEALNTTLDALRTGSDALVMLRAIGRAMQAALEADRTAVWLVNEDGGVARRIATALAPAERSIVGPDTLGLDNPFVAGLLDDGQPRIVLGGEDGPGAEIARAFQAKSLLVVPFIQHQRVVGALTAVMARSPRAWTGQEVATATTLARQGALALERSEMVAAAAEADALRNLDAMKTDFFRAIGHELRTPLTLVSGYLDLLTDLPDRSSPEQRQSMLVEARANAHLIATLLSDLSDIALADAGVLRLAATSRDLAPCLRALAASFQTLPSGERIQVEVPDSLPRVVSDETRVRQIVGNLLGNALRYAPTGPIELAAWEDRSELRIRVLDHGPGIPADEQSRVWERYYRARGADDVHLGGTGIGLALVRTLVEAHGGTVELASSPAGSTFTVSLPLDSRDAAGALGSLAAHHA